MDNETNAITEVPEEQSPHNSEKKKKALFIVLAAVSIIVFAAVVFSAVFLQKYSKNRRFENGITGEYICIDTTAALHGMAKGITNEFLESNFVRKTTLTINKDGKVEMSDIEENLKLKNSSYNMKNILQDKSIIYVTDGSNTKNIGIKELYYYKEGLQWSADEFCGKDRLRIYMWVDDTEDYSFVMTFEKKDKSSSSKKSSTSSYSSSAPESKKLITQEEAADIADEYLRKRLKDGDVFVSNHSAVTFDTISYGDVTADYNNGVYGFKIKATCWGYDSYGEIVDKYKFDTRVLVDAEDGTATGFAFSLKET